MHTLKIPSKVPSRFNEVESFQKKLFVQFDAEQMHLSDVLKLKAIFLSMPGPIPVQIDFIAGEKKVGVVEIGREWGIAYSESLKQQIQEQIASLRSCFFAEEEMRQGLGMKN